MDDDRVVTGEQLREILHENDLFLQGECVTLYVKKTPHEEELDRRFPGTARENFLIGHVEGVEWSDEYSRLRLVGSGVVHDVLLDWIDRVSYEERK